MAHPDGAHVFGSAAAAHDRGPLTMLFAGPAEKKDVAARVIADVVRATAGAAQAGARSISRERPGARGTAVRAWASTLTGAPLARWWRRLARELGSRCGRTLWPLPVCNPVHVPQHAPSAWRRTPTPPPPPPAPTSAPFRPRASRPDMSAPSGVPSTTAPRPQAGAPPAGGPPAVAPTTALAPSCQQALAPSLQLAGSSPPPSLPFLRGRAVARVSPLTRPACAPQRLLSAAVRPAQVRPQPGGHG
jgi:hypothetical protein